MPIQEGSREIEYDHFSSAGQVGPTSRFMENPSAPERKDAESLGLGLFNESLEGWSNLYTINTFSIFFVTTAFLGLLAKGSEDIENYWSSVINVTSISGITKVAQNHVKCFQNIVQQEINSTLLTSFATTAPRPQLHIWQSCFQQKLCWRTYRFAWTL